MLLSNGMGMEKFGLPEQVAGTGVGNTGVGGWIVLFSRPFCWGTMVRTLEDRLNGREKLLWGGILLIIHESLLSRTPVSGWAPEAGLLLYFVGMIKGSRERKSSPSNASAFCLT